MTKYSIANMLLAVTLVCSCVEEEQAYEDVVSLSLVFHQMSVSDESVSFGYRTDLTRSITITAENVDWEIIGLPDWLTVDPASGTGDAVVTLTAQENYSVTAARTAEIHVKSLNPDYKIQWNITVLQDIAQPYISTNISE